MILYDPGQQRFIAGEDTTGDGTALNVRALYQRCPHLGCKPNPCLKNFWFECPCHGSRYDRLGIKAAGAQFGPAPRSMDRFSITVDDRRRPDHQHRQDHARAAARRARPARAHPAAHADRLHLMTDHRPPDPRSAMSDTPGREPEQRLPVPRPAGRGRPRSSGSPRRRRRAAVELTPERAAQVVRQSSNARWVGFLAVVVVVLFITIYWFYELAPARADAVPPRGRDRRPAGHLGRARLQPVRGELRALPRRQRRGRHRPGPQQPGQAVRPPVRRLHQQHDDRRRPVRLRQPELADAGLVERGPSARAAQLHPDRGPDRVHPGAQHADLHDPRPRPQRTRDRPDDGRGRDVQRLARPELQAAHPVRRRSRPAGRDALRGAVGGSPGAGGLGRRPNAPPGQGRRPQASRSRPPTHHRAGRQGRSSSTSTTRTPGRRTTSRSRTRRGRRSSRATPSPASRPSPTRCRRSRPGHTRSSAPSTRT